MSYSSDIREEKIFVMLLRELPGYKLGTVCIYRLQDGQFNKFLNKLELVIQKLLMKDKFLKFCNCNIDFLHEDCNQKELTELMLKYYLVNTVLSSTRITKSSST